MENKIKLKIIEDSFLQNVKKYIEDGNPINVIVNESGWTLLHFATEFLNIEVIEYLVNNGHEINIKDKYGQTPLHIAIDSEIDNTVQNNVQLNFYVTKKLIDFGADYTIKDNKGKTPLDWLDAYGDKAKRVLIKM